MDHLPIWTRDDIVRFTHDTDQGIRSWAWTWLCRHHPNEAGHHAARGLVDPYIPIGLEVLQAFETHPTPEAALAIEALRGADVNPAIREAIEALGQCDTKKNAPSSEEIEQTRLRCAPEELRRRAPAMLLGGHPVERLRALSALACQQYRWATDIILEHFAVLVTSSEDTEVWTAFAELCDPRSMPAILAAWSPGQCFAAKVYARIHYLSGLSGPLPEGVARDAEEAARYEERRRAFHKIQGRASYPGSRRIDFRCRACGRTGEYECDPPTMAALAKTVPMTPTLGLWVPTGFTCKFCGTRDELELPLFSLLSLVGGATAASTLASPASSSLPTAACSHARSYAWQRRRTRPGR